ncbi:MAG: tRNA (adenosine(37)-N6)-threonylcarbamoyltransferase complex ATPase subunit type 1 TsaE [Crocinitomicaceae bacterium]|nr:tRNA (adenosine(37)-N6)-threonylcarbamoyltransferase complex ATPase subunit type 1 TsaE [Crocinitomicaceae bacterium]
MVPDTYICISPDDLPRVAAAFVKKFSQPDVFLLKGEMGVGKTTFMCALCKEMGASPASSPTYSLVNEYETASGQLIYHFDLYRIRSISEALDLGIEEYLGSGEWVFIEWPEVISPLLSDNCNFIEIIEISGSREITF